MKKTLLRRLLMASCFAMLAGCTFSEINKMQTKAQSDATVARAQAQLPRTQHQQPLTWTERQWINPSPIPSPFVNGTARLRHAISPRQKTQLRYRNWHNASPRCVEPPLFLLLTPLISARAASVPASHAR